MTAPAKLLLKRCEGCRKLLQPPVFHCPQCGSAELSDHEVAAAGEVYTYTTVHATFGAWGKKTPYTLAVVEIEEGLRLMAVVENKEGRPIGIGDEVAFSHYDGGKAPIFALKAPADDQLALQPVGGARQAEAGAGVDLPVGRSRQVDDGK